MQDKVLEVVRKVLEKTDNGKDGLSDKDLRTLVLDVISEESDDEIEMLWVEPGSVEENPLQWKTHPAPQLDALDQLIYGEAGVGWAGAGLINNRVADMGWEEDELGYKWLDGHARDFVSGKREKPMPALMGKWTPEQEHTILLILDPIAALAEPDIDKQLALHELVIAEGPLGDILQEMLQEAKLEKALADLAAGVEGEFIGGEGGEQKATMIKIYIYDDSQYEEMVGAVHALIKESGFNAEIAM